MSKKKIVNVSGRQDPLVKAHLLIDNISQFFDPLYGWWNVSMDSIDVKNDLKEELEKIKSGSNKNLKFDLNKNIIKGEYRISIPEPYGSKNEYYAVCGEKGKFTNVKEFIDDIKDVYENLPVKYFPEVVKQMPSISKQKYFQWNEFSEHLYVDEVLVEDINENFNIITLSLGS